jgi:Plasmid replication region DNA-binding N-term
MEIAADYGRTRSKRPEVTYGQIERAATEILKTGVRPTVLALRSALGGGSPRTLLDGLNRYWRDLGNQISGSPDTLRRLPAAVADLAEGLWQQALTVATEAAQGVSKETDGQISRLKGQLELRAHTLSQREVELDGLIRSRERTVRELEEHLRAALSMLARKDVTIAGLEARLAAAQLETEKYRQRLGKVIQRAVTRHQSLTTQTSPVRKKVRQVIARSNSKKSGRTRSTKRR